MCGGNLNTKRPFFQHPLSSHRVLEEREKSKKRYYYNRGHRGGGGSRDVFIHEIQEVLCELCG